MGERHSRPFDIMLQQGLINRLMVSASPGSLTFGMELPYNSLEMQYPEFPEDLRGHLSAADSDGQFMLSVFGITTPLDSAPVSTQNLHNFLKKHKITTRAVDAAGNKDTSNSPLIDQTDPVNQALIAQYLPEMRGKDIHCNDPYGIALRNRLMATSVIQHMRDNNQGLYILQTGKRHVLGHGEEAAYKDSLTALFTQANVQVLPVYITSPQEQLAPLSPESRASLQEHGIVIETGLDKDYVGAALWSRIHEEWLLRKMSRHSGKELEIIPGLSKAGKQVALEHLGPITAHWEEATRQHKETGRPTNHIFTTPPLFTRIMP